MLLKMYKWLVMSGDYQLIVVIGYELASYLLFYSSARCVTIKELFICKNSIFIGDTKINPLFLFFLPPDNFTVKAVWFVGTPSPCRSSTTVFRLPHKRRKGLHVTPKLCLDWWHEAHFFCAYARRYFYRDFSVPFLVVPFFWKREPCMTARPKGAKPSPTEGKPGRMPISSRLKVFSRSDMDIHPLCGLPFHVFRQVPFSSYTDFRRFFLKSASISVYLHFYVFQWAASVSHFRSGCKGNSGIGRKCKVKPPVFSKNLQPFG